MQKENNKQIKLLNIENLKTNLPLLEGVASLWEEAFGDERAYVDSFLSNYENAKAVLLLFEEEVSSMAFLLPTSLKSMGKIYSGFYVYAVGTKKAFRGKGYAKEILSFINNQVIENQNMEFSFLVPSESSLFSFYEKAGYKMGGIVNRGEILVKEKSSHNFTTQSLTGKSYFDFRKSALKNTPHISWGENHLDYAIFENKSLGGESFLIRDENKNPICAFVSLKENDALILREIVFLNEENKDKLTEFLGFKFKAKKLIYKSNLSLQKDDRESFGMIYTKNKEILKGENFYIGLPLD